MSSELGGEVTCDGMRSPAAEWASVPLRETGAGARVTVGWSVQTFSRLADTVSMRGLASLKSEQELLQGVRDE